MTYPVPPPDLPGRPALLNAFVRVLWELYLVLGERTRPVWTTPVIPMALVTLIVARLQRLRARFFSLVERALAGTLTPARPRGPRTRPTGAPTTPRAKDPLPRAAGWLAKLCPRSDWLTQRNLGGVFLWMERLMADEALPGLLASDARIGRALRPLWRMLHAGPPPECLRLPARPRQPRVRREKPDDGWRPPRGVTQRDLARSRAMAEPGAGAPPPGPPPPQTHSGTMTDWTPTHPTPGRRGAVGNFGGLKSTLQPTDQDRTAGWRRRWYALGDGT